MFRWGSPLGGSTLMTSAPQSAMIPPADGPATQTVISTTLIPSRTCTSEAIRSRPSILVLDLARRSLVASGVRPGTIRTRTSLAPGDLPHCRVVSDRRRLTTPGRRYPGAPSPHGLVDE